MVLLACEGGREGASFVFVSGLQRTVDRVQCQLMEEGDGEVTVNVGYRSLRFLIEVSHKLWLTISYKLSVMNQALPTKAYARGSKSQYPISTESFLLGRILYMERILQFGSWEISQLGGSCFLCPFSCFHVCPCWGVNSNSAPSAALRNSGPGFWMGSKFERQYISL